jgi:hemolysin-activating ACP:hemolysin acyltransferase
MRSLCLTKREQKGHTVQATSEGKATSLPELRLFRPDNPYLALGLAVVHLIKMPAFANLRFGDWSQILVGQINRKHYYFVVDSKNKIQGFLGWAITTKDKAEAWVQGHGGLSESGTDGDCIVVNAWAASTLKVNSFLVREARRIFNGKALYFKRYYKDGSVRPGRLRLRIKRKAAGAE